MARRRIDPKDYPAVVTAILNGEHDADLEMIGNAVSHRVKTMFRKGATVRVTDKCSDRSLIGKTGTVIKVNQKSVSVGLGNLVRSEWGDHYDKEFNFPPRMLEQVVGEVA